MPLTKKFWLQFATYRKVLGQIFSHALAHYSKDIWVIFGWGLAGVLGQFAGLGLIFVYAKALETRSPINLYGVTVYLEASLLNVTMVVAAILSLMVLASAFQFAAYRRTVALGCRYEEDLIRNAISEASRQPIDKAGMQDSRGADGLKVRVIRDARICNRILFLLVSNLVDLLFFITFSILAFWVDWVTTMIFSIFLILYVAVLYRINIQGAISSLALERLAGPATREKLNIIDRLESSTEVIMEDDPELEYIFNSGATRQYLGAHERRMTIVSETQFLSGVFGAFAICGVLFMLGVSMFLYGGAWSRLLTYLLALRLMLGKLAKLGATLTNISRLYPHAKRFFETAPNLALRESTTLSLKSGVKGLKLPSLNAQADFLELAPGKLIALISPVPLNRTLASSVLSHKIGDIQGPVALITAPVLADRRPLYAALGIDIKEGDFIQNDVREFGFEEAYKKYFSRGINTRLSDVPQDVPKGLLFLLSALVARHKETPIVFIEGSSLSLVSVKARNQILSWFYGRLLFIRLPNSKALTANSYRNAAAIVFREHKPIGWAMADWLAAHPEILPDTRVADISRYAGTETMLDEVG